MINSLPDALEPAFTAVSTDPQVGGTLSFSPCRESAIAVETARPVDEIPSRIDPGDVANGPAALDDADVRGSDISFGHLSTSLRVNQSLNRERPILAREEAQQPAPIDVPVSGEPVAYLCRNKHGEMPDDLDFKAPTNADDWDAFPLYAAPPDAEALRKKIAAQDLLIKSLEAQRTELLAQQATWREAVATLESERDANAALTAEVERLAGLLSDAADEIQSWGDYVPDYFQKKHGLAGCVAKYRNAALSARKEG